MPEIARLTESTDWIDLDFVERERTPREVIEKGIRHHLARLSLSNTVTLLGDLGVDRSRTAIHNWVQKADLQPARGLDPDHIALDEKMVRVNDDGGVQVRMKSEAGRSVSGQCSKPPASTEVATASS